MTSTARIEANRRNARKSTGPKTPEGKARSRANGLKHGLTGAGVVLAGEDGPAVAERLDAWAEDLRPDNRVESWLVERAATASVRMDRCVRKECAAIAEAVAGAAHAWDEARREAVRAAAGNLDADAAGVVARLASSAEGCDWLIRRWQDFEATVRHDGHLRDDLLRQAVRLLGVDGDPAVAEGPAISALWDAGKAALPAYDGEAHMRFLGLGAYAKVPAEERRKGPSGLGKPDPAASVRLLVALGAEIARLRALRATLPDPRDDPARAIAMDLARFDASPEAALMRRYETAATTDLHRALGLLMKGRKEGLTADSEPECPAQDEPIEEVDRVMASGLAPIDAAIAPGFAPSSTDGQTGFQVPPLATDPDTATSPIFADPPDARRIVRDPNAARRTS